MFERLRRRFSLTLADVFQRRGQDDSLDEELRHHLDCTIQSHMEAGMTRAQAERAARQTLGGVEQVKEECRDQRSGRFLDILWQDLRFAARIFRRSPGFTAAVLITLALGIGANTTIFSVVEGVLLRPLPYDEPRRVALIRADIEGHESIASLSAPELTDLRDHATRSFDGFGGLWGTTAALGEEGEQEFIDLAWVTSNLFPLLGIDPVLGRHFAPGEEDPESAPVILLSHELWQSRFGGEPGIVGKSVRLDDTDRMVVGVMPPGAVLFQGAWEITPVQYQAWIPQTYWTDRSLRWLRVAARLKPGVSAQVAAEELNLLGERLVREHSDYDATGIRFHVLPLHGELVRQARPGILILTGAVGFVLLIACANVAGLLLARSRTRQREVAVRLALGAGRRRIFRQLMTESLLLALGGAALGLLLAKGAVQLLLALQPANLPRLENVGLNWPVAGSALLASLLAGLLFGTAPAWKASRPHLTAVLKQGERSSGGGLGTRARGFLMVTEVALSLVLLIGAGLMIKTFASLRNMDPGFEADGVLSVQVPISWQKFEDDAARFEFFRGLRDSLEQLPGVEKVGATSHVPLTGGVLTGTYAYDAATRERWGGTAADYRTVLPGYFRAIRTPLLSGREFQDLDATSGLRAVIIDESLAQQAWPDEDAVGKTLSIVLDMQTQEQEDVQVLGVARHARFAGLREPGPPQIYLPYWLWQWQQMSYVLRTSTPPMGLVPAVRQQVAQAGGGRPAHNFQAMDGVVSDALSDVRFAVVLLAVFAGMAAVLSAVGLYGIVAYSVSQRTREIGIRVALGAGRAQILRLILRPGMLLTLCGIAAGLPAAAALTRLLSSLLWQVSPVDAQTFLVIPVFLGVVALLACCIPARRALRVEPLLALRHE